MNSLLWIAGVAAGLSAWFMFRFASSTSAANLLVAVPVIVGFVWSARAGLDAFYVSALAHLLLSHFTGAKIFEGRLERIEQAMGLPPARSDPELQRKLTEKLSWEEDLRRFFR